MFQEFGPPKVAGKNAQPQVPEVASSRAGLAVKILLQQAEKEKITLEKLSEEEIRQYLSAKRFPPKVTADDVVAELKKLRFMVPPPPVKKASLPPSPPIKIENFQKLSGVTTIEDEELSKQFEANKKFFEQFDGEVFANAEEQDAVYKKALSLGKESSVEKPEYYYEFAHLVNGGRAGVEKDLADLAFRESQFIERNKGQEKGKTATIVERALAYMVTERGWYGDKVSASPTSRFDDVFRRVDDVLEIRSDEIGSKFLALGIDVTYQGIDSDKYESKNYTLLQSIQDGHKTNIKYQKNQKGEPMQEFPIPKTVLALDMDSVRKLVEMIKNIDNESKVEEFQNDPLKYDVLKQIVVVCEKLLPFAEECGNDISIQYNGFLSSVERLKKKNPEIKQALNTPENEKISKRMDAIIKNFKKISGGKQVFAQAA